MDRLIESSIRAFWEVLFSAPVTTLLAILGFVLGVVNLVIAIVNFRRGKWLSEQALDQKLRDQLSAVTDDYAKYGVKGQFAQILEIQDEDIQKFAGKVKTLFAQLQIVQSAFADRRALRNGQLLQRAQWACTTLMPWIKESDDPELTLLFYLKVMKMDVHDEEARGFMLSLYSRSCGFGVPVQAYVGRRKLHSRNALLPSSEERMAAEAKLLEDVSIARQKIVDSSPRLRRARSLNHPLLKDLNRKPLIASEAKGLAPQRAE